MDINSNIINLEIPIDNLKKLDSLDFSNFANGLLIFHIHNNDFFPIIYRLKKLQGEELKAIILKLIEDLYKTDSYTPIKYIHGYNTIGTNIIYFRLV